MGGGSGDCINSVRENCLNFYKNSVEDMRKRFLEHEDFLKRLIFIDPAIALNSDKFNQFPDLNHLLQFFPFLNANFLATE